MGFRKGTHHHRKLNRTSAHRWAMLRNMVTSLIEHERIVTTYPKAKEVQRLAEKLITLAKRGLPSLSSSLSTTTTTLPATPADTSSIITSGGVVDGGEEKGGRIANGTTSSSNSGGGGNKVYARRQVNEIVMTAPTQTKLIEILGPRYQFRDGGYTRVMKLTKPRKGDNADMAIIEYIDRPGEIRAARPPTIFQQLHQIKGKKLQSEQQQNPINSSASLEEVMRQLGLSTTLVQDQEEHNNSNNSTSKRSNTNRLS